jgi:hypothetical protein
MEKNNYLEIGLIILINILTVISIFLAYSLFVSKEEIVIPSPSQFLCPKDPWINCMPSIDGVRNNCSVEYINWAQQNCPGFEGVAY